MVEACDALLSSIRYPLSVSHFPLSVILYPFRMPMRYVPNDKWSQKAAAEGYRARSVYKLQEMDEKFHLIHKGMTILDVGAAPGSWSQYCAKKLKGSGRIVAIDLQEIEPITGVDTHVADMLDHDAINAILSSITDPKSPITLILSDIAPSTSGVKDIDQWRSIELSQAVVELAKAHLKPGGTCVMKVFRGADFDEFLSECKKVFVQVRLFEAKASRDRSREIYIIAKR